MIERLPKDTVALRLYWQENADELKENYLQNQASYLQGLLPEDAVKLPAREVCQLLGRKLGANFEDAINPDFDFPSPLAEEEDSTWLRYSNMVGVNVRTIGNFFNVVKYALTLPAHIDSIHLLPIWEPGVVASLYGIAGKQINTEFFSQELYEQFPFLDTTERQVKTVVNLLHAMGKSVGMDVIPHTDRYSEIVLANPSYFEWLQREEYQITNHKADLYLEVEEEIFQWLRSVGPAVPDYSLPQTSVSFFSVQVPETKRLEMLFGTPNDVLLRNERRGQLVDYLYRKGLEPVPATMAPPYRGLEVSKDPEALTVDEYGREWRDYEITKPQEMSRVFGPLTRFKFYERKNNNQDWEIDFNQPKTEVWEYFTDFYATQAREYRFDFMRGDMSHVQMRPEGVPTEPHDYYDPHKAVKSQINEEKPWFAYFAETFLAHAGFMAFGDENDHLEMSDADSTLGNLQSMVPGTEEFLQHFRLYLDILNTRYFAPNFTIMTADKDDPRFDKFYLGGNEARLFTGLFLSDMPSYYGLGFECRDKHEEPAPNEHYTKLYVFSIKEGPKATRGPYVWGQNTGLFVRLNRVHQIFEQLREELEESQTHWLLPPDATGKRKYLAWTQAEDPSHLFVVNWNIDGAESNIKIPAVWDFAGDLKPLFSTEREDFAQEEKIEFNGYNFPLPYLQAGECLIFELT